MKSFGTCFVVLSLLAFSASNSVANTSSRVALVVGNDKYQNGTPLVNAAADSKLMTDTLQKAGFEVVVLTNATISEFYEGLDQFKRAARTAEVGLVYFAGHGIEEDGSNYLLPVDAKLESKSQLPLQAVPLESVLRGMEDADLPVKLVVLDCCRNNPLQRSWRTRSFDGERGLGEGIVDIPEEMLPDTSMILFAASPGEIALDGRGENSPFTTALSSRLLVPGTSVFDAFLGTSDDVLAATDRKQEPWVKFDGSGQAVRKLVLIEKSAGDAAAAAPQLGSQETPTASVPEESQPPTMDNAVGGAPDGPEAESEVEVAEELPPIEMPSRGYFKNSEVFVRSSYAEYNSYSQRQIMRKVQGLVAEGMSQDGYMGPNTQKAILEYQKAKGLEETGLVDNATLEALELTEIEEMSAPSGGSSSRSYSSRRRSSGGGNDYLRGAAAAARAFGF